MRLARVFSDYIVLQRETPILIWGESEKKEELEVKINGKHVYTAQIEPGKFSFLIPAQETAENVTLEIGDICLRHVDIGEVWVAGGQSNMEFMLQYTDDGEQEILSANDEHLRMYTIGQYSFAGEREAGYKAWNPWDRWLTYVPEYAKEMSATAVYFAKKLRKMGIPVGILSCNWGGTSASAWIQKERLSEDDILKVYVEEFEDRVSKLDLKKYQMMKDMLRPMMASPESRKTMSMMLKTTYKPEEWKHMLFQQAASAGGQSVSGQMSMEDVMVVGPGEPNEPGTLYENMVKEIVGYSVRGVIWYQGETDENKADIYDRLFSTLIDCWREEWQKKNSSVQKLPFLFVQLAPYGTWMGSSNENYPMIRKQQERVSREVSDTYMASISDIGNIYDIHPKNKKDVGERLALLAEKYIYGHSEIVADAPEADQIKKEGNTISISFLNGQGLHKKEVDFSFYNGFESCDMDEKLLPPILDGINGLSVMVDRKQLTEAVCKTEENCLLICSEELHYAKEIFVEFAQTGFYQVNLYNEADIPVKPFEVRC